MVCCMCPDTPPDRVRSKGTRGQTAQMMINKQNMPHQFALPLKDACCTEPCCCLLSSCGSPFGCTACWARKAVLERYYQGMPDYVCCQGYIPKCCCCDMAQCCKGSSCGLCIEGCCCTVLSLSIARLHLMDAKQLRPDPCDYQLIACSNCLQLVSCILDIVAIFVEQARELAHVVDCIADVFTCSVAGCMGAQISHEIKKDAHEIVYVVVEGVPVGAQPGAVPGSLAAQDQMGGPAPVAVPVGGHIPVAVPVGQPGAPPKSEEMER